MASFPDRLAAVEEALSVRRDDAALKTWLERELLLGQDNFDEPPVPRTSLVTTLPPDPSEGEIAYVQADATNGVIWAFRYRSAGTAGKKWEFVGGPPLESEVAAVETTASGTYVALATAGPSVTVPLAGDYLVTQGARIWNNTASFPTAMSYDIGGTGAVDADAMDSNVGVAVAAVHNSRTKKQAGLAAATALVSKYKVGGGTGSYEKRWLSVLPIRVG